MTQLTPKSSTGMEENVAGLLCYIFPLGLLFYFIEKESRFVKFHGMQATLLWLPLFVLYWIVWIIPFLGWFTWILWLVGVVLSIMMMIKAYNREMFKLPMIGDIAERQAAIGA